MTSDIEITLIADCFEILQQKGNVLDWFKSFAV